MHPEVSERSRKVAGNVIPDRRRNDRDTSLGDPLQVRGIVDCRPNKSAFLRRCRRCESLYTPASRGDRGFGLPGPRSSATDGLYGTPELRQENATRGVSYTASVLTDLFLRDLPDCAERSEGP